MKEKLTGKLSFPEYLANRYIKNNDGHLDQALKKMNEDMEAEILVMSDETIRDFNTAMELISNMIAEKVLLLEAEDERQDESS